MNLDIIQKEFDNYVNLFDRSNYDVNYEYIHSNRVKDLCNYIALNLNLSNEDILLATTIGILHDIGRFKQLEMLNSYDDSNIDHAYLGVKVLFEDNLIEKFKIDKKYYKIIEFAILNHNKLNIEQIDDKEILMHSKIIRDADKIDILKAYTIFNDYKLLDSNEDISINVKKSFYNNESIKVNDRKNFNDKIIYALAFIFDINFKISLKYIKDKKLLEYLYNSIQNKEIFKPYFNYINKYIEERIR